MLSQLEAWDRGLPCSEPGAPAKIRGPGSCTEKEKTGLAVPCSFRACLLSVFALSTCRTSFQSASWRVLVGNHSQLFTVGSLISFLPVFWLRILSQGFNDVTNFIN